MDQLFTLPDATVGALSLDPETLFHTDCTAIYEYYSEAFTVKKKHLWDRLREIIRNALNWCIEHAKKLWNGLQKLRNIKIVSPNVVCEEIKLPPNPNPSAAESSTPGSPADPATDAAESLYYDFLRGVDNGDLIISPYRLMAENPANIKVKGNDINGGSARIAMVLALIYDSTPMDELITLFQNLTKIASTYNVTANDISRVYEMCKSFTGRPNFSSYAHDVLSKRLGREYTMVRVPMKKFMDFQLKLDEMTKTMEQFDEVWNKVNTDILDENAPNSDFNKEIMNVLNAMSWNCVNLQGGLHAVLNQLTGIYYIAPQYTASIRDPNTLAHFVKKCIEYGMPNKFLVNNIYHICDRSMKGDVDLDHPNMGFGRMTLIPPTGTSVYKVAINEYGIRSNKNDFLVMGIIQNSPIKQYFALTTNHYHDYVINQMEKVQAGSSHQPSVVKAMELAKIINNGLHQMGAGIAIADIKPDAFGKKNGKFVIYDYGYIHRTDTKAHKF